MKRTQRNQNFCLLTLLIIAILFIIAMSLIEIITETLRALVTYETYT